MSKVGVLYLIMHKCPKLVCINVQSLCAQKKTGNFSCDGLFLPQSGQKYYEKTCCPDLGYNRGSCTNSQGFSNIAVGDNGDLKHLFSISLQTKCLFKHLRYSFNIVTMVTYIIWRSAFLMFWFKASTKMWTRHAWYNFHPWTFPSKGLKAKFVDILNSIYGWNM